MSDGISVRILGDFGPFSMMGKSIGYEITIGKSVYLLDCGAPLFQQIGGNNLKNIKGLFVTHCHDDHKRWFTDLALFHRYVPNADFEIFLLTSEDVHDELYTAAGPALDRSLSPDSKTIIDIPQQSYLTYQMLGPRARYKIVSRDEGNGKTVLYIVGPDGKAVGPDTAKIIISRTTNRPRMLFKDPASKEWVEPESFYTFSSNVFYEEEKNIFENPEGFTIEAVNAPVWHGVPNIGIKIATGNETLIFSSDTIHNVDLWKQLYQEKRLRKHEGSERDFEQASVLYGDINDHIERIWSEERYNEALSAFKDAVVVHDISIKQSTVHTDYEKLNKTVLEKESTILTHGPDKFTSEGVMCFTDKIVRIRGNRFFEEVEGKLYPMNADIYYKDAEKFYVGYRNERGKYIVYENNGLLNLTKEEGNIIGTTLYRVDLYEDVSGGYFPILEDEHACYIQRRDGRVELVEVSDDGSRGRIVEDHRDRLAKNVDAVQPEEQIVS